jgi:hypothetical protein
MSLIQYLARFTLRKLGLTDAPRGALLQTPSIACSKPELHSAIMQIVWSIHPTNTLCRNPRETRQTITSDRAAASRYAAA